MSDNKKLDAIFGQTESDLPPMDVELKGKKQAEFNEMEDFISLWETHPVEHYREYFKVQRQGNHYLWHPSTQITTDMVFYFVPHKDTY